MEKKLAKLNRSQFLISQSLISAARCADTMFCASKHEQDFNSKEVDDVAKTVAGFCTPFQLDNALLAFQLALRHKNKKKRTKHV